MLTRGHIATCELLDYAEDLADEALRIRIRVHLDSGCTECAVDLAKWQRIIAGIEADRAVTAPDAILEQAIGLFELHKLVSQDRERVVAALVFDSRTQTEPAESREQGLAYFEVVFDAGNITIDLLCERDMDRWDVFGEVHSELSTGSDWKVLSAGPGETRETATDFTNEFRLSGLRPGSYSLTLLSHNHEIVLSAIALPPPTSA